MKQFLVLAIILLLGACAEPEPVTLSFEQMFGCEDQPPDCKDPDAGFPDQSE